MNWTLALLVALIALPGPVVVSWLALPQMVDAGSLPVPLATLQIATAVQGMVLVVLAAAVGSLLSNKVGLRAPALAAIAGRGKVLSALQPQWLPGVVGGFAGAGVIVCFHAFAPAELAALQARGALPLAARLLYGGITEEVLVRWGLMTLLAWAGWRLLQRGGGAPSAAVMGLAIGLSALVFGASHLPVVAAAAGTVSAAAAAYVTLGNALFGLVAGVLFWRHGLESAILAHLVAHLLAFLFRG